MLVILTFGAMAGYAVQYRFQGNFADHAQLKSGHNTSRGFLAPLDQMLAESEPPLDEILDFLVDSHHLQEQITFSRLTDLDLEQWLGRIPIHLRLIDSRLEPQQKQVVLEFWNSLHEGEPTHSLIVASQQKPPIRHANLAIGLFWEANGSSVQAAEAFEREGNSPGATDARTRAIASYFHLDDMDALARLSADPRYWDLITIPIQMHLAVSQENWLQLWWLIPINEWQHYQLGPALLAFFAGFCWFIFALHAGQIDAATGARGWLCAAAVVLGILSTWFTHWLIYWQEVHWQMIESDTLLGGIRYFVLGVGLREEGSKALFLLPLAPILIYRRNEMEMLIVCACVGLGFASLENQQYFAATAGTATIGRFLTANFFHMAATGIIGLAMMRAIWVPRTHLAEGALMFILVVFAHGFYDALIAVPAMPEYSSYGSLIIYILLAYLFFHELRSMRNTRAEAISLTATFLCGVSMLTAVTFVYLCAQFGFTNATNLLAFEVVSMALMTYMFLREMPGSLVTV